MSKDFDNKAYGTLFMSKDSDEEGYRVKAEVMDIVLEHFPEGELVLSMDNVRAKVLLCASDIQFYLETNCEGIDPEKSNEFVLKVTTTILGINRVWKFIDKQYEDPDFMADLI